METKNLALEYFNYLHPQGSNWMVCPRGTAWKEHLGGPMGENPKTDESSYEKWSGCVGSIWKYPVNGSADWMRDNLPDGASGALMMKQGDRRMQKYAAIEQVSLNGFHQIETGSNGKAEYTVGLKNLLLDLDGVPKDSVESFLKWLEKIALPISFVVFTGGKGVHVAVCLEDLIEDRQDAERLCKAIGEALLESGGDQWGLDVGPLLGERKYTSAIRLPGLMRIETDCEQSLVSPWSGYIQRAVLEAWLMEKLPNWKTRKRWAIDSKKVRGASSSFLSPQTEREKAFKALKEIAEANGILFCDDHFWSLSGNNHYRKISRKTKEDKVFWDTYENAVGFNVSNRQFEDLMQCLGKNRAEEFVNYPNLLNLENGVLDLDTLELLPHDIERKFNYCIPISFDANLIKNPLESKALNRILNDHVPAEEDRQRLKEYFGYCFTDDRTKEQTMVLHGPQDTGKGLLLKFMGRFLGPELTARESIKTVLGDPVNAANLIGKRVSIATEVSLASLKDLEAFKALISFEELKTHVFYQGKETITHGCKFLCSANKDGWLPNHGEIRKRIRVVQFANPVSPADKDPFLSEKLWADRQIIFHIFLAAYLKIRSLAEIPMNETTHRYMQTAHENINTVVGWVLDIGLATGKNWVPIIVLYQRYKEDTHDDRMSLEDFSRKLKDAGIDQEDRKVWDGKRQRGRYVNYVVRDAVAGKGCSFELPMMVLEN